MNDFEIKIEVSFDFPFYDIFYDYSAVCLYIMQNCIRRVSNLIVLKVYPNSLRILIRVISSFNYYFLVRMS